MQDDNKKIRRIRKEQVAEARVDIDAQAGPGDNSEVAPRQEVEDMRSVLFSCLALAVISVIAMVGISPLWFDPGKIPAYVLSLPALILLGAVGIWLQQEWGRRLIDWMLLLFACGASFLFGAFLTELTRHKMGEEYDSAVLVIGMGIYGVMLYSFFIMRGDLWRISVVRACRGNEEAATPAAREARIKRTVIVLMVAIALGIVIVARTGG